MTAATILLIALVMLVFVSPVGAYRVADVFDRIARELRHHGGAMAGAYATYRQVRRGLASAGARFEAAGARGGPHYR